MKTRKPRTAARACVRTPASCRLVGGIPTLMAGAAPLPAPIYGEEYPLTRFFTVYVNAPDVQDLPPETREFLNYLLSFEGQTEIAKTGSLPLDRTMLLRARKRLGL